MNSARLLSVIVVVFWLHTAGAAKCEQKPIGYVCGIQSAEDMVAVPGTPWIVTSGLGDNTKGGALHLIDKNKKTSATLFPDGTLKNEHDSNTYPGCEEIVSPDVFVAHGINLRPSPDGVHTLYVVNHGGREAIEVFELDASKRTPTLAWKGCVLLPKGAVGNAVTSLENGAIAVTLMAMPQYFEPGESTRMEAWIAKFKAVQITGYAARWSAREGWKMIPGTEGSGPNGIEASPDGQWLWVANWPARELVRVPLGTSGARSVTKLDFMPDNLRWGDDGQLWVAGAAGTTAHYFDCWATKGCKNDYAIVKLDPRSLQFVRISHPDTLPVFGEATTALKVGTEVWIASSPSDRVGYMKFR